jgi:hypothetical protein
MTQIQTERDWPHGHPKAGDYKGEKYTPPDPPFARDWPKDHPKAADSKLNLAESEEMKREQEQPGALGVPNPSNTSAPEDKLAQILEAGAKFGS